MAIGAAHEWTCAKVKASECGPAGPAEGPPKPRSIRCHQAQKVRRNIPFRRKHPFESQVCVLPERVLGDTCEYPHPVDGCLQRVGRKVQASEPEITSINLSIPFA